MADTIATSPLVKTAFAGGDPNWGRIMMAAGRSGAALDPARLALSVIAPGAPPPPLVRGGTPTRHAAADAAARLPYPAVHTHPQPGPGVALLTHLIPRRRDAG